VKFKNLTNESPKIIFVYCENQDFTSEIKNKVLFAFWVEERIWIQEKMRLEKMQKIFQDNTTFF